MSSAYMEYDPKLGVYVRKDHRDEPPAYKARPDGSYLCVHCGKHWGFHRTSDERCPESLTPRDES